LLLLARARASMAGRDFVVPEDVKDVAVPALAHRITLKPEMWLRRVDPVFVVEEVLAATPAPASGALPSYASGQNAT
jgi:MoxR-like ATPase